MAIDFRHFMSENISAKFSDYFLECMKLIDYKHRTFYLDLSLWCLLGDRDLCNTKGDIGDTK